MPNTDRNKRIGRKALGFLLLATALVAALWSARRFDRYTRLISITDEAIYTQVAYNTLHARAFWTTLAPEAPSDKGMSLLSIHLSPAFALLMAPYALTQNPLVLNLTYTLWVISGCIPLFLLTQYRTKNSYIALVLSLAYLLNVNLLVNALALDISVFSIPFLLWGLYGLAHKRWFLGHVCLFAVLLCEESLAPLLAAVGLSLVLAKDRQSGAFWMVVGTLWFFAATLWILPHWGGQDQLAKVFPHERTLSQTLTRLSQAQLWLNTLWLLVPLGFVPLLGWRFLIPCLPTLALLALGPAHLFGDLNSRYATMLIPFFLLAAADGIARLRKVKHKHIAAGVLMAATFMQHALFPIVPAFGEALQTTLSTLRPAALPASYGTFITSMRTHIPPDAAVCASHRLSQFFSEREKAFVFPNFWQSADFIVVDRRPPLQYPFADLAAFQSAMGQVHASKEFTPVSVSPEFVILKRITQTMR